MHRAFLLPGFMRTARHDTIYHADVIRIIDGDTFVCEVDLSQPLLGIKQHFEIRVRLHDVTAPELRDENGRACRDYLAAKILGQSIELKPVLIDRYGRTVADVFVVDTSVNTIMNEFIKSLQQQ